MNNLLAENGEEMVVDTNRGCSYIEDENGELLEALLPHSSTVVYHGSKMAFYRERKCYCFSGFEKPYKKYKPITATVKAKNGLYITVEDMTNFWKSKRGKNFGECCGHVYLEGIDKVDETKESAHIYKCYFGS